MAVEEEKTQHQGPHDYTGGTGRCKVCGIHYYDTVTWFTPDGKAPPEIQAYIDKVKAGSAPKPESTTPAPSS